MNDFFTNLSDIWGRLGALFSSYNFVVDTIDILLVALLVYKIIKFMRESRALHVVKGIILLLAAYFVVNLLGMQATTYLFKTLMSNFIIVLIILFAPELRHALESVGRSRFSILRMLGFDRQGAAYERQKKAMLEICKACYDMSEKKIGALIVIERDLTLNDIVASGTSVDAKVTKELIGSLFFPNSPLHDGAVIIRDGRVCAAGCILPLTQNTNLSSDLGTRHRASIGLSEQCDAVIIVVSEETGQISIAHKGSLERNISDGVLMERLLTYFAPVAMEKVKKFKQKKQGGDVNGNGKEQ